MAIDFNTLRELLKPNQTEHMLRAEEFRIQTDLLSHLARRLGDGKGGMDPEIYGLMIRSRSQVMQQYALSHSVQLYFSGQGPVAKRLRESLSVMDFFSEGRFLEFVEESGIARQLQSFQYPLVQDAEQTNKLYDLVSTVSNRLFGQPLSLMLPIIPLSVMNFDETDLLTTLNTIPKEQSITGRPFRVATLCANLGEAKVMLRIVENETANLLFYHPQEDAWILGNGDVMLERTVEALTEQWEHLQVMLDLPKTTITVPGILKELAPKIDRVFNNDRKLPAATSVFQRDTEFSSQIVVRHKDYTLVFVNTTGKYPSRAHYIVQGANALYGMRVDFESLSELARKELFDAANDVLDMLIGHYLEPLDIEPASVQTVSEKYSPAHA